MRLGLHDAKLFQPSFNEFDALARGSRQRRAGGSDRPTHDYAAALERRWILIAEQEPELGQLVLRRARAVPSAGDTGFIELDAKIGTDRAG